MSASSQSVCSFAIKKARAFRAQKTNLNFFIQEDIIMKKTVFAVLAAIVLMVGFDSCGNSYLKIEGNVVTGITDPTKVPANVKIPEGIVEIDKGAFYGNKAVKTLTFPKSLREIGAEAFRECKYLESVTFSEGVTKIGKDAFMGCGVLKGVVIPTSVTSIGNGAFRWYSEMHYAGTMEMWRNVSKGSGAPLHSIVHCTDGEIDWYARKDGWESAYAQ